MQDLFILIIWIISWIIWTTMWGSMLIILPFLIWLWLSPYQAIATANFSLIWWFFSWGMKYHQSHSKEIRKILYILLAISIIWTTIWIIILTYINNYIDENIINISVFIALLFILIITLFKNYFFKIKKIDRKIWIKWLIIFFLLSVYWWLLWIWN